MLSKYAVTPALWLLAASPSLAASHSLLHPSVPPASFLNYHVSTVRELFQEVTLDPGVRARLAKHFHISEAELTQYIRRNLILTKLRKGGFYRVACVGRSGREYWIQSHLPAGTAIFASRTTGYPILKLACGNPMVSSLPPSLKTSRDIGRISPPQMALLSPPADAGSTPVPSLLQGDNPEIQLVTIGSAIAPAVVQISPSFETLVPGPLLHSGGRSFNALPAILGGLGVAIASSARSGSTPNDVPPVVPEASTATSLSAMLLLGGALFVSRRKQTISKPQADHQ